MKDSRRSKDNMREKKKSDKKDISSNNDSDVLGSSLNWGILSLPKFSEDTASIISALDAGEYVNISRITNIDFKEVLERIMPCLPVLFDEDHSGWYKSSRDVSVSGYILKHLLNNRSIKQPTELSASDRLASQHAPRQVLALLSEFPELRNDFPALLSNILNGNAVQLEDIENEDVRYGLERLFKCLELEYSRDSGYAVPDGRKRDLVKDSLRHIMRCFDDCDRYNSKYNAKADKRKDKKGSKRSSKRWSRKHDSSSSSSPSSSEDSGSSSDDDGDGSESDSSTTSRKAALVENMRDQSSSSGSSVRGPMTVGPSMPTADELRLAQAANEQYLEQIGGDLAAGLNRTGENADDDDDEDVGPQMYDPAAEARRGGIPSSVELYQAAMMARKVAAAPLGMLDQALEEATQPVNKYQLRHGEYVEIDEEQRDRAAQAVTEREEWILLPGENKLISEMAGIGTQNRKFQTGKVAKKTAGEIAAAKDTAASAPKTEEELRTATIMAEYREKRGLTLMEQHLENIKSGGGGGGGVGQKRKAFDREEEIGATVKLDKFQVQKMVNNAKELDSRFDKGSVQKSFL